MALGQYFTIVCPQSQKRIWATIKYGAYVSPTRGSETVRAGTVRVRKYYS